MNNLDIKKIRKEMRLTQEMFAKKLNVSKSLVQKWESGERTPDEFTISLIIKTHKNTQKDRGNNIVTESETIYETTHDKIISDQKTEIERLNELIEKEKQNLKENPDKKNIHQTNINEFEKQIVLRNQIITLSLAAKKDFIEIRKEENL